MTPPTRVLCLGGGWVAVYLARALRPALKDGRVNLTVVSRDNYSTVHGLIAEMLTCKVQPQQINASVRELIAPAHLHNAEIEMIDVQNRSVLTRRSLDGRAYPLAYDHLVMGLGSIEDQSRYAGMAEHTFPLKTFANCYRLRNHLLSALEMASIETDPAERQRLLTFVVAGGNYAGVEVACDLVDYFRWLIRTRYPELRADECRVVLLEIGPRILPELGGRQPRLVAFAEKEVRRLGIDLRLNTGLTAATRDEAILQSGDRIPTRTLITCTGMRPSPLLEQLPFKRDPRGRLETDAHCRVPQANQVWAGGDCAAVPHPEGGTCPPLAHYAQKAGLTIGRNILSSLAGKPLQTYAFSGLGEACTLGHGSAIAHLKGVPAYGWMAWMGWRFIIFSMFVPNWSRRWRLLADWMLTAVLGRDIVNPRIDDHLGVSHALYEPGQVIATDVNCLPCHYIIESGEVEVVPLDASPASVRKILSAGSYFGQATLAHSPVEVRAKTRVRLLVIDRAAADALSEARPDLAQILKRGSTHSSSLHEASG